MSWTPLKFGPHKGLTLPQVLFKDPDWFLNIYENEKRLLVRYQNSLMEEANDIYNKACNIIIPKSDGNNYEIEYFIDSGTCRFAYFKIVPAKQGQHVGGSITIRKEVIDMSIPRRYSHNDKIGYKSFVRSIKNIFFGDASYTMTKKRCEDFFDDPSNFDIQT